MDIGPLIFLIRASMDLRGEENDRALRSLQATIPSGSAQAVGPKASDSKPAFGSASELVRFCRSVPGVRRWYVARVVRLSPESPPDKQYLDLYFADACPELTNILTSTLGADFKVSRAEDYFLGCEQDHLDWWQTEDFDRPAHLSLGDFQAFLADFSRYPREQPVEEGMVFVEISRHERTRFVQFSFQARKIGKEVMSRLMTRTKPTEDTHDGTEPR